MAEKTANFFKKWKVCWLTLNHNAISRKGTFVNVKVQGDIVCIAVCAQTEGLLSYGERSVSFL